MNLQKNVEECQNHKECSVNRPQKSTSKESLPNLRGSLGRKHHRKACKVSLFLLLMLIGPLYLRSMWLAVILRMDTQKTSYVRKKLDCVLKILLTILCSTIDTFKGCLHDHLRRKSSI